MFMISSSVELGPENIRLINTKDKPSFGRFAIFSTSKGTVFSRNFNIIAHAALKAVDTIMVSK